MMGGSSSLRINWEHICEMWMEAAVANPSLSAGTILMAVILPWSSVYLLPGIRSILCYFGPEFWHAVSNSFTPPVLFILVNIVIFSIWLTSSGNSAAVWNADADAFKDDNQRAAIWTVGSNETVHHPARSVFAILKHASTSLSMPSPVSKRSTLMSVSKASPHDYCADLMSCEPHSVYGPPCLHIPRDKLKRSSPDPQKENIERLYQKPPEVTTVVKANQLKVSAEPKCINNSAVPAKEFAEDVEIKLAKRSATLAQAPARVIVSDIPVGKAIASHAVNVSHSLSIKHDHRRAREFRATSLVMERDELNERIEAFFTRFREQLRQDSLRCC